MEANKPINKVGSNEGSWTDGFWDGAAYGVAGGALAAGAGQLGGAIYGRMGREAGINEKLKSAIAEIDASDNPTSKMYKNKERQEAKLGRIKKANGYRSKMGGGLKGAGIYAGSALLGGVAGGSIDHFNG